MQTLLQDLRYGARMLLKKPVFTGIAIITLSLGIGANTAIFSVINALILKPLPFERLDQLVAVRETLPHQGLKATAVSAADFTELRGQNSVFQEIAAYRVRDITITGAGAGDPELMRGAFVSAGFFSALKLRPFVGRMLLPEEDQPGRDQVVVIGYGLWSRRYAADPNILGATITLNGRAHTVAGVMPPDFDFPFGSELWAPLALTPQQLNQRDTRNLQTLARLKPGIAIAQAQLEMAAIAQRLERQYPQTNTGMSVHVIPLRDQQGEFTRPLLAALIAMAGFLLLIACANVANLLFAQATTRQKEISIRAALGASRGRVIRQLMAESFLLSCLAGIVGLMLAMWAADLIKASLPPDIAKFMVGWKEIGIDGGALIFTFIVASLTTLIFSLLPALQASRTDINETLKDGGKSSGASLRGQRTRSLLVAAEIALALTLLVGAGLMVTGFWRTLNIFEGADPDSILTLQTPLPESKYQDPQKVSEFYREVVERLQTLPGVERVSAASNTPLNNSPNPSVELIIEGRPPLQPGKRQTSDLVVVSPNYFTTIGARLLAGRDFSGSDGWAATPVAIISEMTARRYWPGEDPLGRRIRRNAGPDASWVTIVGIASDVKQSWFDKEIRPALYLPYSQAPRPKMSFLLRTSGAPMKLSGAARAQIHAVDRDQPIDDIKTLARLFSDEMSPFRFAAELMLVFGAIALTLSAVGVYGVMSYAVTQRSHEIGVRIALGAQAGDVLWLIVGQGIKTALIGLALGAPLALWLSRVMASKLFGVVTLESAILFGFVALLGMVAFVSSYLPARRATKVDPIVALRCE